MMVISTKIIKIGNSKGVLIPAEELEVMHLDVGDKVIIPKLEKPYGKGRGILKGVKAKFERDRQDRTERRN